MAADMKTLPYIGPTREQAWQPYAQTQVYYVQLYLRRILNTQHAYEFIMYRNVHKINSYYAQKYVPKNILPSHNFKKT